MNLEPEAMDPENGFHGLDIQTRIQLSIAISLKRIADILERETFIPTLHNDGSMTGRGTITYKK